MPRILIFLLVLTLFSASGNAQLLLRDQKYDVFNTELFNNLEFYPDTAGDKTLSEITKERFKPWNLLQQDFKKQYTYWYKLSLKKNSSQYRLWFLEITDPHILEANAFIISGHDTIEYAKTGFTAPFETRISNHKNFIFPVKFYTADDVTVFLKFKNPYILNSLAIRPAEQFTDYALNEYYLLGLFYGILIIMAIYNFFIFFSTKEKVYLYYVAYVICYCLNSFKEDGIGFQFIWPNFPEINPFVDLFAPLILIISFVFYSRSFLMLKFYSAKLDRILIYSTIFYTSCFVLNHFVFQQAWMSYTYLLPFVIIFYGGINAHRKGNRSAKYFLMAFAFLLFCFSVYILRVTGFITTTLYTVYALNFGFLVEVVLFSYALGQRLKYEKEEKTKTDQLLIKQLKENEILKDSLNRQLEIKVDERTKQLNIKNDELAEALNELQEKNKQIESLNKLLQLDNQTLSQDIKDITKARLLLKDLTLDEFQKIYPDEEACLKYLSEVKWSKSYHCKKCKNQTFSEGKTAFSRRCTKCGYDESVTTSTLFHNSKIPITKTFYLVYLVLAHKNISSHELAEKLELRQKTCWAFKKKVLEAMESKTGSKITSREWGRIFYN